MALGTLPMDMATALEVCLQNALAANPNLPADTCVYNGEDFRAFLSAGLSEDRCCSGFAGVRIAGIRPTVPVEGVLEHCGVRVWQVDLEMGVARCSPVGDIDSGPTCAQLTEVAEQVQLDARSEEHTSELQSQFHLVCRLLLEKKKKKKKRQQQ